MIQIFLAALKEFNESLRIFFRLVFSVAFKSLFRFYLKSTIKIGSGSFQFIKIYYCVCLTNFDSGDPLSIYLSFFGITKIFNVHFLNFLLKIFLFDWSTSHWVKCSHHKRLIEQILNEPFDRIERIFFPPLLGTLHD